MKKEIVVPVNAGATVSFFCLKCKNENLIDYKYKKEYNSNMLEKCKRREKYGNSVSFIRRTDYEMFMGCTEGLDGGRVGGTVGYSVWKNIRG